MLLQKQVEKARANTSKPKPDPALNSYSNKNCYEEAVSETIKHLGRQTFCFQFMKKKR